MRRTLTAAAAAALTLGLVAGPAAAKGKPDNGLSTVGTVLAVSGDSGFDNNGGDFDVLREALVATELVGAVTELTVFAPTDQAFIDAANALGAGVDNEADAFTAIAGLGLDTVAAVLLYHVTPGDVARNELARPSEITMLDGNSVFTKGDMIEGIGSNAQLVDPTIGIKTTDGQIYVIDFVLLPF